MMRRLLLVRHGETMWNADRRYQGQMDVPLSDVGRQQAVAIARRLMPESIDVIYASDLTRAYETAQIIAAPHRLGAQPEPRLREMSFGEWEGLPYAQMAKRFPDQVAWWNADRLTHAPPGGETLAQLAARVQAVLDDATRAHTDQTVLMVSHMSPLKMMICLLLGKSPRDIWQFGMDNTALSEFVAYDLGLRLNLLNDTRHLRKQDAKGRITG
jgi:alpha-ribazole phosphatase